jgi:hypothetical protein
MTTRFGARARRAPREEHSRNAHPFPSRTTSCTLCMTVFAPEGSGQSPTLPTTP